MAAKNIYSAFYENQALEASLVAMQAENNTFKKHLTATIPQCKDGCIIKRAESLNDGFTELESSIEFLKWELAAYNYRLADYALLDTSSLDQVLKNRSLLKKKMKLIKSMFATTKQEFSFYLEQCSEHASVRNLC